MYALLGWKNDAPPEYYLVRAARYLGVPPWELAERPIYWQRLALACEAGENEAEAEAMRVRPR